MFADEKIGLLLLITHFLASKPSEGKLQAELQPKQPNQENY